MIEIMLENWKDLPGVTRSFTAGSSLFRQNDKVTSMFQIIEGEVRLIRRNRGGDTLILQRAKAGSVVAEASLFSSVYHCDAIASIFVRAIIVQRSAVKRKFESDPAFVKAWADHLAQEVRAARQRAEILSLKTVSGRLRAWLDYFGPLPPKGSWKGLAQELGISAEALYREIAKRN